MFAGIRHHTVSATSVSQYTLSGQATLSKLLCLLPQKGSSLIGNRICCQWLGSKFFLLVHFLGRQHRQNCSASFRKRGPLLKERSCSQGEYIISFCYSFRGDNFVKIVLPPFCKRKGFALSKRKGFAQNIDPFRVGPLAKGSKTILIPLNGRGDCIEKAYIRFSRRTSFCLRPQNIFFDPHTHVRILHAMTFACNVCYKIWPGAQHFL